MFGMNLVWAEAVLTATYLIDRIPSKLFLEASLKNQIFHVFCLYSNKILKERKLTKESELNETSEASSRRRLSPGATLQ